MSADESKAADEQLMKVGQSVLIASLVSKPELNGRNGQIESYAHGSGRYTVRIELESKTTLLALKPINLTPEECPICLEDLVRPAMLGCKHRVCVACLEHLKKYKPNLTCPLCRCELPEGPRNCARRLLPRSCGRWWYTARGIPGERR